MTQHERQLREAFESHEHMTPDPAVVYARVQELSRTYRMRRRGAQIAGGAVLGAGLIAGGLVVPGLFGDQGDPGVSAGIPAAAPASSVAPSSARIPAAPAKPSATPSYSVAERAAYFDGGYGIDQAAGDQAGAEHRRPGDLGAAAAHPVRTGKLLDPGVDVGRIRSHVLVRLESLTQQPLVLGHD